MGAAPFVRELTSPPEFRDAFAVLRELRPHLTLTSYEEMLAAMRPGGYRMFAVEDHGRVVAVAGVAFRTNFYYGSYLWVYDLITAEGERSKGHGKLLLAHLEALARESDCDTIALSSGLRRADAHRFYEDKAGFEKASYAFVKPLKGAPFMPSPNPVESPTAH